MCGVTRFFIRYLSKALWACATVCAVPAAGPPGHALLIVYKFHDVCVCVSVLECVSAEPGDVVAAVLIRGR